MPWDAFPPAVVASFSPTTLVIVAGLLSRGRRMRLALSFLAAAGVVTLAVGCAVIGALAASGWESKRRHPAAPPALSLGLGVAALLFAVLVARRAPREVKVRRGDTRVATAVILGVAMGSPSPLYLLSLHTVAGADMSSVARYLTVALLAAIVLLMAEIPILTYLAAPRAYRRFPRGGERLARAARADDSRSRRGRGGVLLRRQGGRRPRVGAGVVTCSSTGLRGLGC